MSIAMTATTSLTKPFTTNTATTQSMPSGSSAADSAGPSIGTPVVYTPPTPVPPSEPTPTSLPPNWRSATSSDGVYYYNTVTGKTQWSTPKGVQEKSEQDGHGVPVDQNKEATLQSKRKQLQQEDKRDKKQRYSDESDELVDSKENERLIRELRAKVTEVVVKCLSKYKVEFGDTERFKKEAKKVSSIYW
jgi:hypothetical protein